MSASPGATALHGPRRFHERRETDRDDARPETVEDVLRLAHRSSVLADMGIGHRKLCRIARAFLATRQSNREFSTWVMAYADPTGERAVWNVLKNAAPGR